MGQLTELDRAHHRLQPEKAGGDPKSDRAASGPGAAACSFSLDTEVDPSGSPRPERLILDGEKVVVASADGAARRQWRLDRIQAWRLEPAIGSCFVQAQVDGRWTDVLRCPGNADRRLTQFVEQLSARPRPEHRPGAPDDRPADHNGKGSRRWQTARRLLAVMRPFRNAVLLILGLSVGAVAIDLVPPVLLGILVNLLTSAPSAGRIRELLLRLAMIVAALLFIRLAATLIAIWKARIASRVGTALTSTLREELVKKLNRLPLAFHDRSEAGVLMSRVAYDTETMHTLLHHITSGLLVQSLQLVGIGIMLFYYNPTLAAVALLPMPLIVAGGWYFTRYLNPRYQHYWEAVGKQAGALLGMLSGIRVVKAFVQERREIGRFTASSHRLRDSRQTVDFSTSTFAALMGLLFALGTLAVWYIGGRDVMFGQMTLGSLTAFLWYLGMFYTPLTTIAESTTWFSSFATASRRIFEVLETPSETEAFRDDPPGARAQGSIDLQGVSFGYDKNRPVLKNVEFSIRPGQMVGIVGRSGSGKSTLVSLIDRLYEADSGRILLDGVDVRQIDARQLRRQIGMVPQEPFLFRGTVAENVAYGHPEASPQEILRAAKQADAHDFLMEKPFAYETQLGEGGSGLSGGERQRMSIARALVYDPAVLILDEATASVDAESERAICETIRRFSRRRTTIVVAHRLSTLRDADRLLVFDLGRLVEQGTHEDLLAHGGLYSTLVRLQSSLSESRRRAEPAVGIGVGASSDGQGSAAQPAGSQSLLDAFAPADSPIRDGLPSLPADDETDRDSLAWLDPAAVTVSSDGQSGLRVSGPAGEHAEVYAVRAFPASHERRFISLRRRDAAGRETEIGLMETLDDWTVAAQEAVLRSLARRYLLRPIREIRSIRTSGNQLILAGLTDGGPLRLELEKSAERFQPFGPGGLLFVDGQGNHYVVRDRNVLPKRQRRLLNLYFGD